MGKGGRELCFGWRRRVSEEVFVAAGRGSSAPREIAVVLAAGYENAQAAGSAKGVERTSPA
jgi:hypothetical protein